MAVTLPASPAADVLEVLAAHPGSSVEEIAATLGDPSGTGLAVVRYTLSHLEAIHLVSCEQDSTTRPHSTHYIGRWSINGGNHE